jgi:hypothetical protein
MKLTPEALERLGVLRERLVALGPRLRQALEMVETPPYRTRLAGLRCKQVQVEMRKTREEVEEITGRKS